MNSGKSRGENSDPDFKRRIRLSRVALSVLLTLTSIWTAVFLVSNDLAGAAILGSLSLLYALCLFLYQMGYLLFARSFWLFSASAATFACIVFGQPFADLDYLFLPIMTLSFLLFLGSTSQIFAFFCLTAPSSVDSKHLFFSERQLTFLFWYPPDFIQY